MSSCHAVTEFSTVQRLTNIACVSPFHLPPQEIELVGTFRYGAICYPLAIELCASKRIDVTKLVTHRVSAERRRQRQRRRRSEHKLAACISLLTHARHISPHTPTVRIQGLHQGL